MAGNSLSRVDNDLNKLYPPFREKLEAVLSAVSRRLGRKWIVVEGYRSQARQMFLFGQGRAHLGSGPPYYGRKGSVVTWVKMSGKHATGCAADCAPQRRKAGIYLPGPDYGAPGSWWEVYHEEWRRAGLVNPALSRGDLGHVEGPPDMIRLARLWTRQREQGKPPPPELPAWKPLQVVLDGDPLPDAGGRLQIDTGRAWVALRPVIEEVGGTVLLVTPRTNGDVTWGRHRALVSVPLSEDSEREVAVPIEIVDGVGIVAVRVLMDWLGWTLVFEKDLLRLATGGAP